MQHCGVQVSSFGLLSFPFVGVLVAAQGLGGREVSAAVVALELPATGFGATTAVLVLVGLRLLVGVGLIVIHAKVFAE